MSVFHLSTIARGVAAGARRPYHVFSSKPLTPASIAVGTSGMEARRVLLDTASALARPAFVCGSTMIGGPKYMWICPPIRSTMTCVEPL